MTVSKDELISVLRLRYDPYSAEAVYELSRQRAELPNDKTALDAKDLAAFRAALAVVGDRVHLPLSHIDEMLAASPASKEASKQTDAKVDTKAEAKPEAKADAKAEAKADAKPESKADAKSDGKKDQAAKASESKAAEPEAEDAKAEKPAGTVVVLTGVNAKDGDQILICGGLPVLGDWKPEKAKAMERKGNEWTATIELASDADVAFKFVRRTADGKLEWEDGDDRQLQAKPRVEATWRG